MTEFIWSTFDCRKFMLIWILLRAIAICMSAWQQFLWTLDRYLQHGNSFTRHLHDCNTVNSKFLVVNASHLIIILASVRADRLLFARLQILPLKFASVQLIRYQLGRPEFLRLQTLAITISTIATLSITIPAIAARSLVIPAIANLPWLQLLAITKFFHSNLRRCTFFHWPDPYPRNV